MIGLFAALMIQAQVMPEKGKYYHIVNQNPDKSAVHEGVRTQFVITEDKNGNWLSTTEPNGKMEFNQIWLCTEASGSTCKMQNVLTKRYFSSLAGSTRAVTGNAAGTITISTASDASSLLLKLTNQYFHSDGSNNLVGWYDTSNKSNWWTFDEITYTESDLAQMAQAQADYALFQAEKKELESIAAKSDTYAAVVATYFSDKACTQLKSEYASMTDEAFKTKMTADALPEQVQAGILAIKNKWAGETNPTISERFRIQDYSAYAAANLWRWNDGLGATQMNDMNNPTGIFTNKAGLLLVFVEGAVPAGCELRLSGVDEGITGFGYNNYNNGTSLKEGLNVIAVGGELTEYWVMYSVTNKTLKPADMAKIKIHIEGGNVIGYVNYNPNDEAATNAEYEEILKHANKAAYEAKADKKRLRLATRGVYGMCYWQIMTYNRIWSDGSAELMKNYDSCTFETEHYDRQYTNKGTPWGFKIWKSAKFYDDVLHQEFSIMGFLKDVKEASAASPVYQCFGGRDLYPTYCNCHAYTIMGTKGGNPHSSTGYTHMPGVGAVESSYNAERPDFDVWCVGHESGHNNQGSINLQSSTESSNNLFSNIITYWYGYRMGRGGSVADNENYWQQGVQFSKRDIGMTMMMYFQLYQYYHLLGKKMDFYPTFFNALRADALNLNSGKDSWLKFYKMACEAAGEDLTEFFRFWGFFETFENVTFGDYSNRTCSLSQSEVDAAIKYVKDKAKQKGWRENLEIMFIETRQQLRDRWDIWASSETNPDHKVKPNNSGNWRTQQQLWQDYGNVGDIFDFQTPVAGEYTFLASGTNVTMQGKGGVGFLVYNKEGQIVGHSNKFNFTLPTAVASAGFVVKVINADGTLTEAKDALEYGDADTRLQALKNAIEASKSITSLEDNTGNKVGYYSAEALAELKKLVEEGKQVVSGLTEDKYAPCAKSINAEMLNVQVSGAMQTIKPTGVYTIQNYRDQSRYLTNNTNVLKASTSNTDDASKWVFVPTQDGKWYMQNYSNARFVKADLNEKESVIGWTVNGANEAESYMLEVKSIGDGTFYIENDKCLNLDGADHSKIAAWSEDPGSQWYITKVGEIEPVSTEDVNALIANAKALVEKAGTVSTAYQKLNLQCTDKTAPYYVSTNKANSSYPIANLIDGNKATDFYTKKETSSATPHNFVLDLGEGNEANCIRLTITTPNNGLAPRTIVVTPGETSLIYKAAQQTQWNDLPDGVGSQITKAYDTNEADQGYRYWRFQITDVHGSTAPQFGLAEIQVRTLQIAVDMNAGYESLEKNLVVATENAYKAASTMLASNSTMLSNSKAYTELWQVYEALFKAMDELVPTGVQGIDAETVSQKGIFNLSGQKVGKMTKSGLYIVNGKKVMVK